MGIIVFLVIGFPYLNEEMWQFVMHKGEGGQQIPKAHSLYIAIQDLQ